MKRPIALAVSALTVSLVAGCSGSAGGGVSRLNGGGSSFIYPLMMKWAAAYDRDHHVKVDYSSTGSGNGIQQMTLQTIDFGCTDAPMNQEQLDAAKAKGGAVIHVPLALGGVVPAYNLPGVDKPIQFTGPVLADIFLGKIKKWNDAALKEWNKDIALPDMDIAVVHRSDGSGTTYIWADYLSKVSPQWKEKVGVNTALQWPCGIGEKGTEGIAGQVKQTPGALGYVELIYALKTNIPYGSIRNRDGHFVLANLDSVTAAASGGLAQIPEDLRFSLTDAPGQGAYPVSGTTWAVLYEKQPPGKAEALADFLRWVTHEGQDDCKELQYARLPTELVARIEKKLDRIQPGK